VTERSWVLVLKTASCVKNRVRLHTIQQKWWDPFLDPAYAGALVHRVALLIFGKTLLVRASSKELLGLVLFFFFGQCIAEHMCPEKGRGSPNPHKKYMAIHK